jgi:predicted SprT family Zn-dependent metalloprotease
MTDRVQERSLAEIRRTCRRRARSLAALWEPLGYPLPDPGRLGVTINRRYVTRLGSAFPQHQVIALREDCPRWSARQLRDVLTHELAHLAVHARHGAQVPPHGPEWKSLMALANVSHAARLEGRCGVYGPAVRKERLGRDAAPTVAVAKGYEHRCPVCQMSRFARRPVPQWRCRSCAEAGLTGRLLIAPVP